MFTSSSDIQSYDNSFSWKCDDVSWKRASALEHRLGCNLKRMQMVINFRKLQHPTGFVKIIEVILGIICISLMHYGCFQTQTEVTFVFVTASAYLIITPCILVVDVLFGDEHQKPHLAAALNIFAVILYLGTAGVTLTYTKYTGLQSCHKTTIALGVFAVFNTLAYAVDTTFTLLQICGHKVT